MHILIVSPTKDSAKPLQATLQANGFIVESTQDGEPSNQSQYDLIIVDASPETGLQICTQVRKSGGVAPILVLAEKSDTTTKAELLNAGADDCLAKPFATEEIFRCSPRGCWMKKFRGQRRVLRAGFPSR